MASFSRRNGIIEEATKCGLIDEIRQRPNQRREEIATTLNLPLATLHRLVDGLHSLNQIDIINGKIKLNSPMYTNDNNNAWSNTQQLSPPAPPYTMMQHIPIHGGGGSGAPPPYPVYPPFISIPPYHHIHNTAIYTSSPYKVRDQGGQPNIRGRQGNLYMVGNQYQLPHGGPPLPPPPPQQQQQQQQQHNFNYPMPSPGAVARLSNDGTSSHPSYKNNNNSSSTQQQGPMYPSVTYSSTPGTGGEKTRDSSGRGKYITDNNNNNIDDGDDGRLSQGGSNNNNNNNSTPCAFFLKTGTCAWGDNCRFAHPYDLAPEPKFNSMGLPVRLDQPDCVFYMRTGRCSFGFTCKYNHPDSSSPVVVVGGGGGGYNNNNNVFMPMYGYGGSIGAAVGGGGGPYQYGIGAPPNGGLPRMAPPPRRKQPVVVDNNSNNSTIGAAVVVEVSGKGGGGEVKEANYDSGDGGTKDGDDSGKGDVERETEEGDNQHGV
jgi:hypothetical protein